MVLTSSAVSDATQLDANVLSDFKSRVNIFVADALKHIAKRYKSPRFGRPQYPEDESWRFSDTDEKLVKDPYRPTWLQVYGRASIIETLGLLELAPFRNLLELVESKPELRFLLCAYWGLHGSYNGEHSTRSLLSSTMEYKLVREFVGENRSFEFSNKVFDKVYGNFQEKLLKPFVRRIQYAPLRQFTCRNTVELTEGWMIRLLRESEVSEVFGFGVLPVRHVGREAYLGIQHQFALIKEEFTEIDALRLADEEYLNKCRRLSEYKYPIDVGSEVAATLNLISDETGVIIGEPWCVVELACGRGLLRSQALPAQSRNSGSSFNLSAPDVIEFVKLWDCLRKPSTRKLLELAVLRFSSGITRVTNEDAIVDLAIAAESLFAGKDPGEATYRISVNAALWLDDTALAPSDVRVFFRNVYQERSRIVHGSHSMRSGSSSIVHRAEMRKVLTELMRHALKKAVLHLAEDNPLEWAHLLDNTLNLRWNGT